MSKTCATCRYWSDEQIGHLGRCRRYPPAPTGACTSQWPIVHRSNWCGEHQPREQEPEKPKEREPGWYWVKHHGRSIIAEWCHWDNFRITGSRREFCEGWRIDGTEYVKEAARQISPRLEPPT